jgi:bifunctional non-homologous end joining protein LigD
VCSTGQLIVAGAPTLRPKQFAIDGEVVVLDKEGISDFEALASRRHDKRAQFYAFYMLSDGGEDLRPLALSLRKDKFARLLSRPVNGIFLAEYERRDIGQDLFHAACRMGLEGICFEAS